jgi:hypothetical protein
MTNTSSTGLLVILAPMMVIIESNFGASMELFEGSWLRRVLTTCVDCGKS